MYWVKNEEEVCATWTVPKENRSRSRRRLKIKRYGRMSRTILLSRTRCTGSELKEHSHGDNGSSENGCSDSAVFDTVFMVSGRESAQHRPIITVPQPPSKGIQGFTVINPELIALAKKLAI
jgi:hypothetical protein